MKLRKFIENLQNADNAVKKRWLIGLSGVSIIFVVGLWLIYLNYYVVQIAEVGEIKEPEIGFWRIMESGFAAISNQIRNGFYDLFYKIIYKRTIMIE